ncbi:MAG TPA: hypothetical protein VI583_10600 [Cyclobacteriaceae bacterium]|nr:hypothetical protein [Cyclobacteriaceae bacterium]
MKFLIAFLLFCILFSICWPLAIGAFFLFGFLWLILLPFQILGFTIALVFKIVTAILLLPFKLLGLA